MEQLQEREERLNQYAKDKVVARLVENVKKEIARQEEMKKSYSHAPQLEFERWLQVRRFI